MMAVTLVGCGGRAAEAAEKKEDVFDAWLDAAFPPADGFDAPGNGTVVRAIANGRVSSVEETSLAIEHVYYVNHERREVRSIIRGLAKIDVEVGAIVKRGQTIATQDRAGRPMVSLDPELELDDFVKTHRSLFVPQDEKTLVLVDTSRHRMRIVKKGKIDGAELEVGLGQKAGCKEKRGDLKTPCGMYFVVAKSRGPFSGDYAEYFGGHFVKLNYPNAFDAARGVADELVTDAQRETIAEQWERREMTSQGTRLGGGIGFHGWAEEWEGPSFRGSWGCVFLHNREISDAFDRIPKGAMVVLM
jgi:hypothetical protein